MNINEEKRQCRKKLKVAKNASEEFTFVVRLFHLDLIQARRRARRARRAARRAAKNNNQ